MNKSIFEDLHRDGLISDDSLEKIRRKRSSSLFSIHWELKTILYLGVMALSTGLAILVYKNIDSISHQVVLIVIAMVTTVCFTWCYRKKAPFGTLKVESPNSLFDYILLLGTLSFLSLIGYLQFQFEIFGSRYGLAAFIPMIFLFFTAYYFDHLGILTLAIANLAVWMGVSLTPKDILQQGNFAGERTIYIYLALGALLLVMGYISGRYDFKMHFCFTYQHLGIHLTFISLLSAYFYYNAWYAMLWVMLFAAAAWFIYKDALRKKSFYFIVLTILYSYIALSGFVHRTIFETLLKGNLFILFLYFIVSGASLVRILMGLSKKMK